MPSIELKNINNFACRHINMTVSDGELLVLLGPTGAGKTTLLNIMSGLIEYEGSVLFDGIPMEGIPTNRRGVGYLFQDLVLFPHLTVASNITYGLRMQKWGVEAIEARLRELMDSMNIHHLAGRYPKDLSGGEKQRVALARAIAPYPKVLLLDEPFNNLDMRTTKYLRIEFRKILKDLGLTAIFVTHSLKEAQEMADRIAVLDGGRLEQIGSPREIFFDPHGEEVSDFLGSPNILECVRYHVLGNGLIAADCNGMEIIVPYEGGGVRKVAISPGGVYLSRNRPPGPHLNRFQGVISKAISHGSVMRFTVKIGSREIVGELPRDIAEAQDLREGMQAFIILKLRCLRIL
jgi:ABC-type Fe3+/spermidine/putrescine transport system ATPase subunit